MYIYLPLFIVQQQLATAAPLITSSTTNRTAITMVSNIHGPFAISTQIDINSLTYVCMHICLIKIHNLLVFALTLNTTISGVTIISTELYWSHDSHAVVGAPGPSVLMAVTCMHVVHMICFQSIKRNVCELREQLFVAICIVCYVVLQHRRTRWWSLLY